MARTNFSFQKRQKELAKKKKKEEKLQRKLEKKGQPAGEADVTAGPNEEGEQTVSLTDGSPSGDAENAQEPGEPAMPPQ